MSKMLKSLVPYEIILVGGFILHATFKYFANFNSYPAVWAWLGSFAFCVSVLLVVVGFGMLIDIFRNRQQPKAAGKED